MNVLCHTLVWLLLCAVAFEQANGKAYTRRRFDKEEQAQARFTAGILNKFTSTTTTTTTTAAPVTTTIPSTQTTTVPSTTTTTSPAARETSFDVTDSDSDFLDEINNDSDLSGFDDFGVADDVGDIDVTAENEEYYNDGDRTVAHYKRYKKVIDSKDEQQYTDDSDDDGDNAADDDESEDDGEESGNETEVGRSARAEPSEWRRRQLNRRLSNRQIQRLENEYRRRIKALRERQKDTLRRTAVRSQRAAARRRLRAEMQRRELEKQRRMQRQRKRRRQQAQRRRRQAKLRQRRRRIQNNRRLNRIRRAPGNKRIIRVSI